MYSAPFTFSQSLSGSHVLPNSSRRQAVAATVGGAVYVAGGSGVDGAVTDLVEVMLNPEDPEARWEISAPMPQPRSKAAAAVDGTSWYVTGGVDAAGVKSNLTWRFDSITRSWETLAPLTYPRADHGLVVVSRCVALQHVRPF